MESIYPEGLKDPKESSRELLNLFLLQTVMKDNVAAQNINRLLELDQNERPGLLDDELKSSMQFSDPPDWPICASLRRIDDFQPKDELILKLSYGKSNMRLNVDRIENDMIGIKPNDGTYLWVPPTYPGLFISSEFDYYLSTRRGSGGSVYSPAGGNIELTRLLQHVGIGEPVDDSFIRRIKRMFEVNTGEFEG